VPVIIAVPKFVGRTAYCDNNSQFSDFCVTTDVETLGAVARLKVRLQFVKSTAP